ncbi:hypothetical protein [Mesobacillus jeotgali]|uniref:Uncharacterized protein n=1 Tax=Mesobacillus jeotgali TaxID=129985 RepID=A0ABY9VIB5_9BACI|nr:hypothetical protein [Mesobacillus jeotgali]WNF22551.1 hypothetical protein RH061_20725 [Mesobacillus jeotgali]
MKVYDTAFNANEWFVIISMIVMNLAIWFVPKLFSKLESVGYYIFGIYIGLFYDHTLSIKPWDFYDVNDNSSYQFIDFMSYIMYGPYGYFFLYFYAKWNINKLRIIPYILIWSAISMLLEWIGLKVGLFHFDKGYKMHWSFPIYLLSQTMIILFYHLSTIYEKTGNEKRSEL